MTQRDYEERLFELFKRRTDIPASTDQRLGEVYDRIIHTARRREKRGYTGILNRLKSIKAIKEVKITRRTALVAAAIAAAVLCAGGALAYGITHSEFFRSVWGGEAGTEIGTYQSALGETHEFPAFERVELDIEAAERTVGEYIVSCNKTYTRGDCTFTLLEYMCDDNGMGYLCYTLENPNGLDFIKTGGHGTVRFERLSPDGSVDFALPGEPYVYTADGKETNCRTVMNSGMSTGTKAYLSVAFTAQRPLTDDEGLRVSIGEDEYIDLPAFRKIPSALFTDADRRIAARVSPLGISVGSADPKVQNSIASQLIIEWADDAYVVESDEQHIVNAIYATRIPSINSSNSIFNRLVITDGIISVIYGDYKLLPTDSVPDTTWHFDSPDSAFHYFRTDGTEVFALSADILEKATREELERYEQLTGIPGEGGESRIAENDLSADDAISMIIDSFGVQLDFDCDYIIAQFTRYDLDSAVWEIYFKGIGTAHVATPTAGSIELSLSPAAVHGDLWNKLTDDEIAMLSGYVFSDDEIARCADMAATAFASIGYDVSGYQTNVITDLYNHETTVGTLGARVCDSNVNPTNRRDFWFESTEHYDNPEDARHVHVPLVSVSTKTKEGAVLWAEYQLTAAGAMELSSLSVRRA